MGDKIALWGALVVANIWMGVCWVSPGAFPLLAAILWLSLVAAIIFKMRAA
jgi:hypothetical protein